MRRIASASVVPKTPEVLAIFHPYDVVGQNMAMSRDAPIDGARMWFCFRHRSQTDVQHIDPESDFYGAVSPSSGRA